MDRIKLSISVMAHPSREKYFNYLKDRLGDVPFAIDTESKGVWENCKKAWRLYDPTADFHLVVQDDAIICDEFLKKAKATLCQVVDNFGKDTAVSFYYGYRQNLREEQMKGMKQGYLMRGEPTWGVAICLPTKRVLNMISNCDRYKTWRDDARIGVYLRSAGIKVYFPIPSLVNHRTDEEAPSLVGDPGKFRRAFKFIDDKRKN